MLIAQGRSTTGNHMRKTLVVAVCGLAVAGVAACGGSSEDAGQTGAAPAPPSKTAAADSSTTASASTAPAADNAADQAIADSAVLKLSDFPSGWTGKPDDSDDAETLECGGYQELRDKAVGRAESETFDQEDNGTLSQVVLVWPTEAEAREVMSLFSQQDFVDCVADTYRDRLEKAYDEQEEGLKLGDVEVSMLRVEDHGDESAGIRAATSVSQGSIDIDVTVDVNAVRVDRAVSLINAIGAFSPVTETDRLSGIAADRLASNLHR
jgi:hypothetical protein